MTKKREILPKLNAAIIALSNMSGHAAKLEHTDNNVASKELKKAIITFQHTELEDFKRAVLDIRTELREKPKRPYNRISA